MNHPEIEDLVNGEILPRLAFLQCACLGFNLSYHNNIEGIPLGKEEFAGLYLILGDIEEMAKKISQ